MSLSSSFDLNAITQGLTPTETATGPSFASLVGNGIPASPTTAVGVTDTDSAMPVTNLVPTTISGVSVQNLETLQSVVYNAQGQPVQGNPLSSIDLGNGQVLSFDLSSMDAQVTPAVDPSSGNYGIYDNSGDSTFTASDCLIMVEVPQTPSFNGSQIQSRVAKQLVEATTLSVSIHRSKSPVRAFGYANPKGFARGSRTIAGTLVLTKSTAEVLYRFLQSGLVADVTRDTNYTKLDQLPPLDFTLLFSNEEGYMSSQRLLGVEFVTDGTVVSVQDILLEQQITWMAADFTPLAPLNFNSFFGVNTTSSTGTSANQTPGSVIASSHSSTLAGNVNGSGTPSGSGLGGSDILDTVSVPTPNLQVVS